MKNMQKIIKLYLIIIIKYTKTYNLCGDVMTQMQMLRMLDFLDKNESWLFDTNFVCRYFKANNRQNIRIILSRFAQNGLIEELLEICMPILEQNIDHSSF